MRRNHLYAYAIVRFEANWDEFPIESRITVKKVVFEPEYAASEVRRLNELNHDKGSHYFATLTRIEQPLASSAMGDVPRDGIVRSDPDQENHCDISTIVDMTAEELAELREATNELNPAVAIRTAVVEHLRYVNRMKLKELSGRVEMQIDWLSEGDE